MKVDKVYQSGDSVILILRTEWDYSFIINHSPNHNTYNLDIMTLKNFVEFGYEDANYTASEILEEFKNDIT